MNLGNDDEKKLFSVVFCALITSLPNLFSFDLFLCLFVDLLKWDFLLCAMTSHLPIRKGTNQLRKQKANPLAGLKVVPTQLGNQKCLPDEYIRQCSAGVRKHINQTKKKRIKNFAIYILYADGEACTHPFRMELNSFSISTRRLSIFSCTNELKMSIKKIGFLFRCKDLLDSLLLSLKCLANLSLLSECEKNLRIFHFFCNFQTIFCCADSFRFQHKLMPFEIWFLVSEID